MKLINEQEITCEVLKLCNVKSFKRTSKFDRRRMENCKSILEAILAGENFTWTGQSSFCKYFTCIKIIIFIIVCTYFIINIALSCKIILKHFQSAIKMARAFLVHFWNINKRSCKFNFSLHFSRSRVWVRLKREKR